MSYKECDCGCGKLFSVKELSTHPHWHHPEEGGKIFSTEACKEKYLLTIAHPCVICKNVWVMDGEGVACPAHYQEAGEAIANFNAGIPG
ncbi:hypothetical protein KC723_01505 [Candidatus Kaiserbacteria bacterium]|nr:hypothetical protein [Candidatus Kaiserbacteria bacterium]